jgi:hypothetical protein
MQAGLPVPPTAFASLRRHAQTAAENRQYVMRMTNLKQDRQLHRMLAFTGRSE